MAMKEDQEKTRLAGCDAYIAKPLRYLELYAADRHPARHAAVSLPLELAEAITAATILIVDDEAHNRKLLETMLKPEGYLTVSVASGEDAIAAISRAPPDLVLLDIMMPGMDWLPGGADPEERSPSVEHPADHGHRPLGSQRAPHGSQGRGGGFPHQAGRSRASCGCACATCCA
jgi:CheY-like chemotaxis protein